jgi:PIN domain nuclease of toxin-antitoxin system
MKVLLDTNALIWWFHDNPRLSAKARSVVEHPDTIVLVSTVSLWEITIKWRIGKMEFSGTSLLGQLDQAGMQLVSVSPMHLFAVEGLAFHHRDPFDHLILAQAKVEGAAIITSDEAMAGYGVPCIPAMR